MNQLETIQGMVNETIGNEQNNKISIILSVFNGDEYLKYAIESILNQTFIFFDFIIDDNDSDTPKFLKNSGKKIQVKVIACKTLIC